MEKTQGVSMQLHGRLGQTVDSCVKAVMQVDYTLYVKSFTEKWDKGGGFSGEFWGKWFTSAVHAYRLAPTEEHRAVLDDAVRGLLGAQEPNGRLSSYQTDWGYWDVWGRKYALLGLVRYYELTGDAQVLSAIGRMLDHLSIVLGDGGKKVTECGLTVLEGLASVSILEPVVLAARLTGKQAHLDFAKYIAELISQPNHYNARGQRLVEDALENKAPIDISAPKGYEIMSCLEGLCELAHATNNKRYIEAAAAYAQAVLEHEIMIVGSGSSTELWCDGAKRQTGQLEQPMETCVAVTWMKLLQQLLRATGDPLWADQMEITLYNALLGAILPGGEWWAYFSQLAGERMPSPVQVQRVGSSCCVANGPRALLALYQWGVMAQQGGIAVNLYAAGQWQLAQSDGQQWQLRIEGEYPKTDVVRMVIEQAPAQRATLALRIPAWSAETTLEVNGQLQTVRPGNYEPVSRLWQAGDIVTLKLDMRGRVMTAPGSVNHKAVMRGPIVLALDNRLVPERPENLWLLDQNFLWKYDSIDNAHYALLRGAEQEDVQYIDLTPVDPGDPAIWMAFEVPFLYRPTNFYNHERRKLTLCDYASAGNCYNGNNLFRVWMPQPMYMNALYPKGTTAVLKFW